MFSSMVIYLSFLFLCNGGFWKIANRRLSFCLRLIPFGFRLSVIFIHDPRHGGTFGTIDSLSISWNSHPSEVLPEPPSLPDSPTKGCCDWTEVSLSSCVSLPHGKLSRFPSFIFLAHSFEVVAYGLRGCRDFIPAAGLTYSECCIFNFQAALKSFLFAPLLIGNWERCFETPFSESLEEWTIGLSVRTLPFVLCA